MNITLCQLNFKVGDLEGNCQKILLTCREHSHSDILVFPELAITGYPPEDLLLREDFLNRAEQALNGLCKEIRSPYVIVGHPQKKEGKIYNAASLIQDHRIIATYHKQCLPNYGVFDEQRYFEEGNQPCIIDIKGWHFALMICEDLWQPGPIEALKKAPSLDAIISLNASPYDVEKQLQRLKMLRARQAQCPVPIFYVNLIGGQDELVFDGNSFVLDAQGEILTEAPSMQEATLTYSGTIDKKSSPSLPCDPLEGLYQALVLGTRDYVHKNGFKKIVLGLSGGIDSALVLTIAVDALGAENVQAVMMPSRYTRQISLEDAAQLARNLNVDYQIISIEPLYETFLKSLSPFFLNTRPDMTEENLQARCRGMLLMALSNKFNSLVLITSNKSESAVGYSTLYGDMAGGFAPIKDLLKTQVYALAYYRNQQCSPIPEQILTRAPSAELALDQTDQDSLPPYDILDKIITAYVEKKQSAQTICEQGIDKDTVDKVIRLIQRNEYKRRQSPPGIRVSPCAFGRDWRYPITQS